MAERQQIAQKYLQAQMGDPAATAEIIGLLAEDVSVRVPRAWPATGRDAVAAALANQLTANNYRQATWEAPREQGDSVEVVGRMPATSIFGGFSVALGFNAAGRISSVVAQNLPAAPLTPTGLRLTDEIKQAVNDAWRDAPILVASVGSNGEARLSYRGSMVTLGDDKLGFWARNTSGETITALSTNPRLTAHYRNPQTRATYTFYGNAAVTGDARQRLQVYETMCENERLSDPDARGIAVIIELDRIEGSGSGGRIAMRK